MLIFLAMIFGAFLFAWFVPVCRKVLIEGVFNHTYYSCNNYGGIGYHFDYCCRSCLEHLNVEKHIVACAEYVLDSAIKLSSFNPNKGDSIKIIVWKSIFGRIIFYRIVKTNFAEETYDRQIREYEAELLAHNIARERNHAMKAGLSVEEYRKVVEVEAKKRKDFYKTQEDISEDRLEKIKYICQASFYCLGWQEMNFFEYVETGVSSNNQDASHIKNCTDCLRDLGQMRQRYLAVPTTHECFSDEELLSVEQTGILSEERRGHSKKCYRCFVRFENREEKHLKAPSGPECLTKSDCHTIHSTGEIPESCKGHITSCLRCANRAEKERNIYINGLIPIPPYPKRRLESFKGKQKS